MGKKRRKGIKQWLSKKPLWLTAVSLIVSAVAIAGIIWIIKDTRLYQNPLRTIQGSFDRYEVVNDRYVGPSGIRITKQGNLYIDGELYVISSDSLNTFDVKNFEKNVDPGEMIIVEATDEDVLYSIKDVKGTQYLSLAEAQANSAGDNLTGLILCFSVLLIMFLLWCFYEKPY